MKKVKLDTRIEKAINAFFENETLNENSDLSFTANDSTLYPAENAPAFFEKHKTLISILKQVFLFLPGAFFLFFVTIAFTGLFILYLPGRGEVHLLFPIFVLVVSALMTFLGLGDWRNPKHLLIPGSIMTISIILGIIGSLVWGESGFIKFIDHYGIYFFPLALIAPFLVKSLVDRKIEDA